MHGFAKILTAALLVLTLASCGTKSIKRSAYTGSDQVGAIDIGMLVGTWDVKVLNPRESDPPMDAQITVSPDGSISGYSAADFTNVNQLGRVVYDVTGSWSVNGDTINQTLSTVEQKSGSPLAKFGVSLNLGLLAGQTTATNVYEASANHLIIVNEKAGVARYFTRKN